MRRLSREELADEARTSSERVDELVRVGAITPGDDGGFESADVQRVELVAAYEAAGIDLQMIETAIGRRWFALNRSDEIYPDRGPRSRRTFAEFAASLGDRAGRLGPLLAALGLPPPEPGAHLGDRDERVLAAFLDRWDVSGDPGTPVRAARIAGEAMRRTVEGWVELFTEQVSRPLQDRTRTVDELQPVIVPRAAGIVDFASEFLVWLFERHLESGLNAVNIASMEAGLAREGLLPARPKDPPAVAFVDLAGYTRLTQELGDELAARSAARLAELAGEAARRHDGRLVKLLGDGAMLHFPAAADAVHAALDLVESVPAASLPAAHVGIDAGSVVSRDGDLFGHTVNLAARLSSHAAEGEVVVTADLVEAAAALVDVRFEPLGEASLRGVLAPVAVFRASRDR